MTENNSRYTNPILDRIDGLIGKMGLDGAAFAIDDGTVRICFNNKKDAQFFGRFLRKNNFEEITLREEGENLWFMTADAVVTRRAGVRRNFDEDMNAT